VSSPLLETKFHVPRRRQGLVTRPRLIERFGRGGESPLTLVSAPAGFGKTTLLTEWLTAGDEGRATAWLSLDKRDNDPALFWTYLISALERALPGVGAGALAVLQSAPSPIEPVLATLLNELDAVADEVVLVLDDYHLIERPDIQEGMAFLLDHLPPQVHLVIAGRADPALPLARLRARGELVEIRAADLRFTPDEAAAYLNEAMSLDLTAEDIDALETRTEGWIAALQLAALSMQDRDDVAGFIAGFAGDDRFVVDYLVGEVLARQPDDVRTFLLQTSVLSGLTGSLCDAVTGQDGGGARLESLERANLFLVPLDDRRRWYRYHHLFADVLRTHLLDEAPELVPELHRRAGDWCEAHDDRAEAIRHAMAAGDTERAATLVELAAPELQRNRQDATVRGLLEALPAEVFANRPVLAMHDIGARMVTGDVAGVEDRLDEVERRLDEPSPEMVVVDEDEFARLPAHIAMYRAALALLHGDREGTIAHARRSVDLRAADDHMGRAAAAALAGLAHWSGGDLEAAADGYAEAVAGMEAAGNLADVLGCSLGLADMRTAQGRLREALSTLDHGLQMATDPGGPTLRGTVDMHVAMAEVLYERNDLDAVRRHLDAAKKLGEHAGLPQSPYRWRAAMARLAQLEGDDDGALELLDEAEQRFNTDYSPAVRPVPAMKARLRLSRGDVEEARRWAIDRQLGPDDELSYLQEYEHITLARVLLAEGSLDEATQLLERLLEAAEAGGRIGSIIEVLVLLALAQHARGDAAEALASLERALALAEPEGYVRVFLHEGPEVLTLLEVAAQQGSDPARRLLAQAGQAQPSSAQPGLVDPLSDRELEVLRLLRSELTGPEIADQLFVSLNTMRTHTKRIYTKLGVNSRRAAVRRADELGL
jgi:LuxR family transcriptional regulator, maltose regulon positive regulatory protein